MVPEIKSPTLDDNWDFTVSCTSVNVEYRYMVYHHYSVPTILQVVTRICFRKKLFYYRF